MTSEKGCRKDKNQNIQVFVRLRPLNQRERDIKSLGVIEVLHNREVVVRQSQQSSYTKKFTFDRAFGPNVKQVEVYQEVVSPLIEEVLAGYNCTVFAYGQTGTGKTHTMVGENTSDDTNWQNDPLAGIIPRALSQLFDELRISNTEHTVRVSYLELYNEELFDLLSNSEDNSKLRIYEDVTRKGSNIVNGLEEITVSNKNEVYKIMAQGQERKRVASTLMNAQSSRSHTVFTIVVHMKENSPEGEELVKIGKLNLVDLAGSENISKAGSDNPGKKERARECVNINQSLLTLGRVITALVEKHPHIPYRESKLTRILQESLGGRTKTSIIATISPGHKDLEETMSTLDYANRAKNIQNKPEVNQKMTKKAILRQYAEEIDRLKKDLQAARDKNGVFLSNETYTEITLRQEEQRKEIQELLLRKRAMEEEKEKTESIFTDLHKTLEDRARELQEARRKLTETNTRLINTHNMLRSTQLQAEERAYLVEKHRSTEASLSQQARELLAAADAAVSHVRGLHDSVERRRSVESRNLQATLSLREQAAAARAQLGAAARARQRALLDAVAAMHSALENFSSTSADTLQNNKITLDRLAADITLLTDEIKSLTNESQQSLVSACESHRALVQSALDRRQASVEAAFTCLLQGVAGCVLAAQNDNLPENVASFVNQWHAGAAARIESLRRTHSEFSRKLCASETARGRAGGAQRAGRRGRGAQRVLDLGEGIVKIEEEKAEILARLAQQQTDIETERRETEVRLNEWVEEERRLFEERLRAHVQRETAAMETRLSKKAEEIESERSRLEARVSRELSARRALLAAEQAELQRAEDEEQAEGAATAVTREALECYSHEFDNGTAAISSDMEALPLALVGEARRLHHDLLRALRSAEEQIQTDSKAAATQDSEASEQFLAETETARENLVRDSRQASDTVLARIEAMNSTTASTLCSVSCSVEALARGARHHAAGHGSAAQDVTSHAAALEAELRGAVERLADLERRYLSDEYKPYSPTGATPQRSSYRYPRALAATSPHEKLLERYRAQRGNMEDDECIVVESDTESRQTSDGESSLSEDSAVFAAPSPPAPPAPRSTLKPPQDNNHTGGGIVKCTSESDIYNLKRSQQQQGKENAERCMSTSYGKPSKLRAPSSHKKPLVDRNGAN